MRSACCGALAGSTPAQAAERSVIGQLLRHGRPDMRAAGAELFRRFADLQVTRFFFVPPRPCEPQVQQRLASGPTAGATDTMRCSASQSLLNIPLPWFVERGVLLARIALNSLHGKKTSNMTEEAPYVSQDTGDYVPQLEAMVPLLAAYAAATGGSKPAGRKPAAAGGGEEMAAAALRALNAYDGMLARLGGSDAAFPALAAALVAVYAHSQPGRCVLKTAVRRKDLWTGALMVWRLPQRADAAGWEGSSNQACAAADAGLW